MCTDLTAFGLTHDFCKDSPIQTCCSVNKNLLTVLYIFDRIVVSKGHCNFQSGLCGLKPDKNGNFHWTVGSGQTPTESTGPSYDHTSLNMDGKTRQNRQLKTVNRDVKISINMFSNRNFKPVQIKSPLLC